MREPETTTLKQALGGTVQRLYVKRGCIPDGRGVTHRNRYVTEGMQVTFDDHLVLHLTKSV